MYVVLDSNIWINELGLNSGLGAAIRLFLLQNSAIIALPEVVRLETKTHIRSALTEYITKIEKNHSQLLTVFGNLKEITLPSDKDIEEVVTNIFTNLEVSLEEVPFSLESARSSFNKIIKNLPPSDKNQQFKDGVIWADCMYLLENDDVHFVTNDRAFFNGRNYEYGLSKNLELEAKEKHNKLKIHSSLTSLLENIRVDIEIKPNELFREFLNKHNHSIQAMMNNFLLSLGDISSHAITAYATTSPNTMYIEFELEIECSPIDDNGPSEGKLILKGDAKFNPSKNKFDEIRRLGEEVKFISADGKDKSRKSAIINIGPIMLGHRDVQHEVKYKLD